MITPVLPRSFTTAFASHGGSCGRFGFVDEKFRERQSSAKQLAATRGSIVYQEFSVADQEVYFGNDNLESLKRFTVRYHAFDRETVPSGVQAALFRFQGTIQTLSTGQPPPVLSSD